MNGMTTEAVASSWMEGLGGLSMCSTVRMPPCLGVGSGAAEAVVAPKSNRMQIADGQCAVKPKRMVLPPWSFLPGHDADWRLTVGSEAAASGTDVQPESAGYRRQKGGKRMVDRAGLRYRHAEPTNRRFKSSLRAKRGNPVPRRQGAARNDANRVRRERHCLCGWAGPGRAGIRRQTRKRRGPYGPRLLRRTRSEDQARRRTRPRPSRPTPRMAMVAGSGTESPYEY